MKTVMRSLLLATIGTAVLAIAPAASATTFAVNTTPNFTSTAGPGGTFSGGFYNTGLAAGAFSDTFTFTLPTNGFGSGTVTTSANVLGSPNDLDFTSVTINGVTATLTKLGGGLNESAFANNVPIVAGVLNSIVVTGVSRGNGAYGGQLAFIPGVPEPATWGLLMVGFGMVGVSIRRRSSNVVAA